MDQKEQLFCSAYCDFLSNLIEAPSIIDPNSADYGTLFHLGESHCLSYAHQKIKIQGIDYKIKPKITFGGKAFHFARRKEDAFKAITKANFDSVPDCSKVFVSFGEIDCRADEGFIEAAQKLDIHIDELITDVVKGYFTWFVKQNEVKHHHLYFFNVPAPIYAKDISPQLNAEVASTVIKFNAAMQENAKKDNFALINVHKLTAEDNFRTVISTLTRSIWDRKLSWNLKDN